MTDQSIGELKNLVLQKKQVEIEHKKYILNDKVEEIQQEVAALNQETPIIGKKEISMIASIYSKATPIEETVEKTDDKFEFIKKITRKYSDGVVIIWEHSLMEIERDGEVVGYKYIDTDITIQEPA